jgi:hypothetical protein
MFHSIWKTSARPLCWCCCDWFKVAPIIRLPGRNTTGLVRFLFDLLRSSLPAFFRARWWAAPLGSRPFLFGVADDPRHQQLKPRRSASHLPLDPHLNHLPLPLALGSPPPLHPLPHHRLLTNQAWRRHERAASGKDRSKDRLTHRYAHFFGRCESESDVLMTQRCCEARRLKIPSASSPP